LGSPVLLYLAASGVGTLGVIDGDAVEASNLQRQIIHSDQSLGMPKVFSAEAAVRALNPFVTLRPYHRRLEAAIAAELVADYDLVIDGSDNFDTRYLVNRVCAAAGIPLIAGAITQWEGQVSVYDPARGTPCYECVFPVRPDPGSVPTCAEAGVAAPLPGVVGSLMALEAVKLLTGAGTGLAGRLVLFDGLHGESRTVALERRPGCAACGGGAKS
jgi:molybdopterin-synthase adenylyltransferase